jgi:1-phosphatidylinositol-4-phosphate 5-kinase
LLPSGGTATTSLGTCQWPCHPRRPFRLKAYATPIFARLRRLFGIDEVSYGRSIGSAIGYHDFNSQSLSGSFFFASADDQFVIKSAAAEEAKFMLSILHDYYNV